MTSHPLAVETETIEIPPLTGIYAEPFSVSKLVRMMGFFGPAAVVASLSLGAGETIMVTELGAWSEYGLLWLLVLSVLTKGVFLTYLVGRYTAITGQRIGDRLVKLPGPRGWLLLAVVVAEISLIGMGLTTVAKPCGNLIANMMSKPYLGGFSFETWENLWTTLLMASAMTVCLLNTYKSMERQQIVICGLLVGGTILATILVKPDLRQLLIGALSFGSLPPAPSWAPPAARNDYALNLVTVFGYVGGGLSGYLAYSSWVGMSGWGINSHPEIQQIRQRARTATRIDYLPDDPVQMRRMNVLLAPLRWDAGMGALVLLIVTAAFLTAGATVLYPRHQAVGGNAWELLTKQASIWRGVHTALVPFYYISVVLALWGTLVSVPESSTRVIHDFLSAIWPRFEAFPIRRLRTLIVAWFFITTMVWTWSAVTFDLLTQIATFVMLSIGVLVIFLCVLYFNVTLPRGYRPSWWVVAGSIASTGVLVLCALGSSVGLARKVFMAL